MQAQTAVRQASPLPGGLLTAARSPIVLIVAACFALGAISAAVLPSVPSYDPWAWIVWGKEIVDPHLDFALGGGPSWKPLPVIFTAIFALLGGGAPTLWMILARAGGLLGLVAGYRLARALVGSGPWGALAGVIAAVGLVLTQQWGYYFFRGTSEPLLAATSLWAVERHLAGRYGVSFVLAVATGLMRPEAWPFIAVYAAWVWVCQTRLRALVLAGLATIPLLWFGPPGLESGQPLLAAVHASEYNGHLGSDPLVEVLRRGLDLQVAPVLLAALVGALVATRQRETRWLLGLIAGWWVVVVGMTLDGYPGLARFFLPAAALTCVLGGVGFVAAGLRAAALLRPRHPWLPAVAVAGLIGVSAPFAAARVSELGAQGPLAARASTRLDQLGSAVSAVGGYRAIYPCFRSFVAVNHSLQTALAWKLDVTLGRVGTSMRHQGVMFVGPHDTIDGIAPRVDPRLTERRLIARVGAWQVYRMTAAGADNHCVGR